MLLQAEGDEKMLKPIQLSSKNGACTEDGRNLASALVVQLDRTMVRYGVDEVFLFRYAFMEYRPSRA